LPLPDYLASLLGRMPRYGAYVFEGPRGRLNKPRSALEEVARRSAVPFCLHDLRRTFATVADSLDIPGYGVKALLNHKGTDVTAGYVVASTERLREPMQKICDYVLRCAGVEASAEVLPFERADRPRRREGQKP
jgi:integrase